MHIEPPIARNRSGRPKCGGEGVRPYIEFLWRFFTYTQNVPYRLRYLSASEKSHFQVVWIATRLTHTSVLEAATVEAEMWGTIRYTVSCRGTAESVGDSSDEKSKPKRTNRRCGAARTAPPHALVMGATGTGRTYGGGGCRAHTTSERVVLPKGVQASNRAKSGYVRGRRKAGSGAFQDLTSSDTADKTPNCKW